MIIPIFIPHKGCPFDCIYCNQKSISGEFNEVSLKDIDNKILEYLKTSKSKKVDVAFYGGSFTGLSIDEQKLYLDCVTKYILEGKVNGIRMSTRPDYINDDILEFLSNYKIDLIELGVQSLDEEVLVNTNRGHNALDVYRAIDLLKDYKVNYGIQTMIGLPGETIEKVIDTANEVISLNPKTIRIYPTLVIKGTYLEKMYLEGNYIPLKLDEAIDIAAVLLKLYNKNSINVIRLGLQPTENLIIGKDLIAGPFHPSFRQLVESKVFCDKIIDCINKLNLKADSNLFIYANKKVISNVVGMNKKNIKVIKKTFNFNNLFVKENNNIKDFIIETD
jgi:histone acetyltransferase (RNA polymerase elongator complex component)